MDFTIVSLAVLSFVSLYLFLNNSKISSDLEWYKSLYDDTSHRRAEIESKFYNLQGDFYELENQFDIQSELVDSLIEMNGNLTVKMSTLEEKKTGGAACSEKKVKKVKKTKD